MTALDVPDTILDQYRQARDEAELLTECLVHLADDDTYHQVAESATVAQLMADTLLRQLPEHQRPHL